MPPASRILIAGTHLMTGTLLLITLLTAVHDGEPEWWVLAAALVFALVYAVGLTPRLQRDRALAAAWGAVVTLAWVGLVISTPMGVWLAFPLFFLAAHLLPLRLAVPAVALLTLVSVLAFAWHNGWGVGGVVGPILGAVVALGTVLGLGVVGQESEQRGALDERDRLAREIHDTLAQGLNSIHLLLGAAEAHLDTDPEQARSLLRRARETAAADLEETRRFVRALAPPDLAERSLSEALARVAARSSPTAEFQVSGEPVPLPGGYDVALLRIAQEALTNVHRHAAATRVAMTLSYLDDEVILDVVDDGVGAATEVGGFGMSTMRGRAETLGGTFVIESTPGRGTAVAAALPLGTP